MWFPVFAFLTIHGALDTRGQDMAGAIMQHHRAATQGQCIVDAISFAGTLRDAGFRGRFVCMKHDQSDRALAAAPKFTF